jgi:hypothetical protein
LRRLLDLDYGYTGWPVVGPAVFVILMVFFAAYALDPAFSRFVDSVSTRVYNAIGMP